LRGSTRYLLKMDGELSRVNSTGNITDAACIT